MRLPYTLVMESCIHNNMCCIKNKTFFVFTRNTIELFFVVVSLFLAVCVFIIRSGIYILSCTIVVSIVIDVTTTFCHGNRHNEYIINNNKLLEWRSSQLRCHPRYWCCGHSQINWEPIYRKKEYHKE